MFASTMVSTAGDYEPNPATLAGVKAETSEELPTNASVQIIKAYKEVKCYSAHKKASLNSNKERAKRITAPLIKAERKRVAKLKRLNEQKEKLRRLRLQQQRALEERKRQESFKKANGGLKGKWKSLGTFYITNYCPCSKCCGKWANGVTSTGTTAVSGRTIAVDPRIIPYGSEVCINGNVYIAEDCGGAIKNKHIDIYKDSHDEALSSFTGYTEVWIKVKGEK